MIASSELITYYYNKYNKNYKEIMISVTNKCNIKCKHCNANSSPENDDVIKNEIIDMIFEQLDSSFGISIFGGEAMLFPEKVFYIAKKCREKNIIFNINTNGFWGKDKKILNFIKNEIKPNLINISLDEFHTIDYRIILNIIKHFKNHPIIGILMMTIQNHDNINKKKFDKYRLHWFIEPLTPTGRSKMATDYIQGPVLIKCACSGIDFNVNGDIYAGCGNHQGCFLGNIKNKSLPEIYEKYCLRRIPKFFIPENKSIQSAYSHCVGEKLNSIWDNENHIKIIGN
jgi:hypothetical protein